MLPVTILYLSELIFGKTVEYRIGKNESNKNGSVSTKPDLDAFPSRSDGQLR